ncbi:MAG: FAS1-like dehydratase domain-containing protein [Inquilinaceae bacterium]
MSEGAGEHPTLDPSVLNRWIGRQDAVTDVIDPRPARLMRGVVGGGDGPDAGAALPPLWHWLYFLSAPPLDALGRDGHARLGGFLPPVALPRRMWAGGRLTFHRPIGIGDTAERRSEIVSVALKRGRAGPLCFVTVSHVVSVGGAPCLTEEHDIVYRDAPKPGEAPGPPARPPTGALWARTVTPDPVMLFRYSALTFNGHRIHYDRLYCREVEGYPGLVVHGPLIATLLVAAAVEHTPDRRLAGFSFRAVAPLFDTAPFVLKGRGEEGGIVPVWAETPGGGLAMRAEAVFA